MRLVSPDSPWTLIKSLRFAILLPSTEAHAGGVILYSSRGFSEVAVVKAVGQVHRCIIRCIFACRTPVSSPNQAALADSK
jgi:hypothetical protein